MSTSGAAAYGQVDEHLAALADGVGALQTKELAAAAADQARWDPRDGFRHALSIRE